MADVVLSAKMSDSELLKSIDDTLGKAQTKFDNFTKGINTNLGKVNSIPNGALGVNEFKQATDALESYRKKQDDISKAWADFEGKNSRIADTQSRIVEQKEKERLAQEKINELREKEINAAWQQKDSQDANIRIKSEQQLQKEIEQGQKAVQQRQRESDRASEKERSNILSQIDKEKELARIQDERKRQTSILESLKTGNINLGDESYRLGDLKEMRDIAASYRNSLTEGSSELNKMNGIYQQLVLKIKDAENTERSKAILMEKQNLETAKSMPETNIAESENKLKRLLELKQRVESQNLFNEKEINSVNNAITRVNKNIEKLKLTSAKTTSMSDIFGMSEKTLNDVASKMKAISEYRMNFGAGSSQLSSLNKEYERLSEVQKKSLTQGIELEKSNNKLGASWSNLMRRVAFYASLGAFTGFMKSLVSVRAEFEMTERSLGALLGSWEKGTEIFNKIQANALKSPFSILELSQSAKQLIAYNFAESEVVDTTRRLADISSALGVPMERLVYNLGQIKAQGVLTARDARDFANAGLAIVPMLAKMYTEQKRFGNVAVTTANVYDMMTKKMVSYNDVMSVMNKITDEGGMFFDFQAKQAEILKGKLSNLGDAYDLMLNQMGQENSGFINGTVSVITTLVRNWKSVEKALLGVVFAVGLYKSAAISAFIWSKMGVISSMATSFISLAKSIFIADASAKSFAITMKGIMMTNPFGVLLVAVTAFVGAMQLLNKESEDLSGNIKTFGDSAGATLNKVDTLYKTIKGTTEGSNTYKKAISELNTILDEYGIRNIREIDNLDEINKKREQAIELIKTEGIERERANALEEASKQYTDKLSKAKTQLIRELQGAMTDGLLVSANDEIRKNAQPIASVIASIVNENIDLIANKQGKAYEDGMGKIFSKIQDSMRKMGLDEEVISKSWLTNTFGYHTNIIKNYLSPVKEAKEEYNNWTNNVENWANAAKRATDSTMTFKQKTDATNRALQKQTESVHDLYKNIKNLMSQYSDNNIGFTINVGGDVPEWMMGKKVSELERLAKLFASAGKNAKGGAKVNGVLYSQQELLQRGADYATAAELKQLKIEQEIADKNKDKVDYQLQAIEKELQLIDKLRKGYDDLKKAGYSAEDAKGILAEQFAQNIKTVNSMLNKFGIAPINMAQVAGTSDDAIKKLLETQVGKLSSVAAKDKLSLYFGELQFSAKKTDISDIVKNLESKLTNIKAEYELSIELQENEQVGNIFASLFNIDTNRLAKTAQDVVDKMQDAVNDAIKEYNARGGTQLDTFNIISDNTSDFAKRFGLSVDSDIMKPIITANKQAYDFIKKALADTSKDFSMFAQTASYEKQEVDKNFNNFINILALSKNGLGDDKYQTLLQQAIDGRAKIYNEIEWKYFQQTADYQKAFGDLDSVSTQTLQRVYDIMNKLRTQALKSKDAEHVKIYTKQMEDLFDKISERGNVFTILKTRTDEYNAALANQMMLLARRQQIESIINNPKSSGAEKTKAAIALNKIYEMLAESMDNLEDKGNKLDKAYVKAFNAIKEFGTQAVSVASEMFGEEIGSQIQTIFNFVDALGEAIKFSKKLADTVINTADKTAKAISTMEKASVILTVISAFMQIYNGIMDTKFQKEQEEREYMQNLIDLQREYNKTLLESKMLHNDVFGSNQLGNIMTDINVAQEAMQKYIESATKQQKKWFDPNHNWLSSLWGSLTNIYAAVDVLDLGWGDALRKSEKEIDNWAKNVTDGYTEAINNLRYITQKGSKGFLGIGSKGTKTTDLTKWVKDNIGADLFDKNGIVNLAIVDELLNKHADNLTDDTKNTLQELKQYAEIIKEVESSITEWATNVYGDLSSNLSSALVESFKEGTNAAESFQKYCSQVFENLGQQMIQNMLYKNVFGKYQDQLESLTKDYSLGKTTQEQYSSALALLVGNMTKDAKDSLPALKQFMEELKTQAKENGLSIWGAEGSSTALSSLQQGLQGVTETTAGVIEGYMNNLTQQNYLQSSLMQNLVNNSNASLGTQSQMLLQLQQGYQVQLAIQGILQGWSSNSGRSVRVEMIN